MAVTQSLNVAAKMQRGTVARLNPGAGFGYVHAEDGENTYIFVVGRALNHSQARKLRVGRHVSFRVSDHGRVDELVVD